MEKVIVITGAGGVLCSGFAEFLAGKGNKAALLDLNEEAAQRVADKITAAGGVAKAYKCNVLDKANIEEVHGKVLEDLGKCDILINGAGGNNPKCTTAHEEYENGDEQASDFLTFFNIDEKGFDFVFDLNIKGVLLPSQVFMAVTNFTEWLAVHFAKENIRVNAIAPGFFVTNQNRALLFNEDGTATPRTDKILRSTPMGRFGEAEELLGAVEWLLDESKAGFVTGVTIPIDGGFSAYSGV